MLGRSRQYPTEYLGGRVESKLVEDLALACCETSWLYFASNACLVNDERVAVEGSQNGLRCGASFFGRRAFRNIVTIDPLNEEVEHQSNHH